MPVHQLRARPRTAAALTGVLLAATTALPAAAAPAPGPVVGFGASGPTVAALQRDLAQLGYRRATATDGTFGPGTWVALVFFQRDSGLPPSGEANARTWQALDAAVAADPAPLLPGAAGAAVTALQLRLASLGFAPGAADGVFGAATTAALIAFQRAHLLPPTGFPDPATRTALAGATPPAPAPPAPVARPALGAPAGPAVLAYWAVWGPNAAALASLQRHGPAITWLSPYWYTLESNATLRSRESDHAAVLAAAAAAGARVLALINDGPGLAPLLATGAGRTAAAGAVAALLASNPALAGVMIDFESLPASSGSALTAFVATLRATLPASRTVGVAVGPEVSAHEPGEGLYQYAALGRVADLVQVMTYDAHDGGTAPGPVAPLAWTARVARFAASVIPPDHILLGVPAYGYDWSAAGGASTLTLAQALSLAAAHGASPHLDVASGEDTFTYRDGSGTLHTVWFEAPAGVAAKRALAAGLGLRGLAVWTLGGESPGFWTALTGA